MILWGAKGLAKEILSAMLFDGYDIEEFLLFDNFSVSDDSYLLNKFKIIKDISYFNENTSKEVIIAVGNPLLREKISNEIFKLGCIETGFISTNSLIGKLDVKIHNTAIILSGCTITASVSIGKTNLINKNVTISHDVTIGDYCEVSPNVNILGRVKIGNYCVIGTGAIILPDITVGNNCIIGAGAVVTKDIQDNTTVTGIPAKVVQC